MFLGSHWLSLCFQVCIGPGLATETDIEVASFALRHTLSAAAVTEILELIQRASLRSKDEDEPFALTHRALRSRVASVAGLAGDSAAREARCTLPMCRGRVIVD
jgi:hypothetical protein